MRSLREQCDHLDSRRHHWVWTDEDLQHSVREEEQPVRHAFEHPDVGHIMKFQFIPSVELENQVKHRETYTPEMARSHALYKGFSSYNFNSHLRNSINHTAEGISLSGHNRLGNHEDDGEHPDSLLASYHAMDKVASHPTVRSFHTYRGFNTKFDPSHLPVGHEMVDHGYTGTTESLYTAATYSDKYFKRNSSDHPEYERITGLDHRWRQTTVVAKIHVPPGTYGHYLDLPNYTHSQGLQDEREFVLHRGTRFRITDHTSHVSEWNIPGHNIHVVHMTVVGQEPKKILLP